MMSDSSGRPGQQPSRPTERRLPEPMAGVFAALPEALTPGVVVDALVPDCADLAWIAVEMDGLVRVCAYTHIDPRRLSALDEFQQFYTPAVDDPHSLMARVMRTVTPELVRPAALAEVERRVSNPGTRAALLALGARTSLIAPICQPGSPPPARAVLLTAMSSSGRTVDEDDLADLAQFAHLLSSRLHW